MSISAYTYRADHYCGDCVMQLVAEAVDSTGHIVPGPHYEDAEQYLARVAGFFGIRDREDEHTFDSGDFPKVVFSWQIESTEHCGECGEEL